MGKKWRISLQTIFFTKKLLSRHVIQVSQKEKKIFKNFSQSEAIMSPGSYVGWLIGTKVTPLGQTMQRNIPAKFGQKFLGDH
jgi:hypothetical protein